MKWLARLEANEITSFSQASVNKQINKKLINKINNKKK